jgi:acetyl-CoA C-acetyltransferase
MRPVYIVEATRSPLGRRGRGLSTLHPAVLLGKIQGATLERAGVDAADVGQVVGGCVAQVGEQTFNVARVAWLTEGFPQEVPATTVDAQCGSSQQAFSLAAALVGSGQEDVALACGVESMSRVTMGANFHGGLPFTPEYATHYQPTSQFQGAERLAARHGLTRDDTDAFGLLSQQRAIRAWDDKRFEREVIPVVAPQIGEDGQPSEQTHTISRDEGLRETTLEQLGQLKPAPGCELHTAGSSSQISDGASAVLLASEDGLKRLGVTARARVASTTLVGVDPEVMLEGPMPATEKVLALAGLSLADIDTVEVNEAFAAVALVWRKTFDADPEKLNPNGGAIAIGHPLGSTGCRLLTTALHELERIGGRYGLVAMCCGGGLGTGTVIERV